MIGGGFMPKKSKNTKNTVVQSNALARATITPPTMSVWEERVISTIAARNCSQDFDFREQTIKPKDLAADGEVSTSQFGKIKLSVKALADKKYFIPMGRRGFIIYPVFVKIALEDDGTIVGKFNPELKEYYLELTRQFTMLALPEFQALTSVYSQRLFRYLSSWCKTEKEKTVSLEELHALLGTPESFRKDFKSLRVRVLDVAHKEINADTSLEYDWEPIKEGLRKVVEIRFIFDVRAARSTARKAAIETIIKPKRSPEDEEIDRLQAASNTCFEKFARQGKECGPKKRSPRCKYCLERGRMGHKLRKERLNTEGSGTE
jgi:hypothetical protein